MAMVPLRLSRVEPSPHEPIEEWPCLEQDVLTPTRWERDDQRLSITKDELLPGEAIPLLKNWREVSRSEALKLWREKVRAGWVSCHPQW